MLTQTGYTLDEVGRSLSWRALGSFLNKVKPDSALAADLKPDVAEWSTTYKTNLILADIYDLIAQIGVVLAVKGSKKRPPEAPEYPREWRKKKKQFTKVMTGSEWLDLINEGGEEDG